ncbi:MAG: hypothetical protein ACR2IV_01095 [Bryobacteraceae bacterium]
MSRPSFRPTEQQRKMVRALAALGHRHEEICVIVRLRSPKTLRKHFHRELLQGSADAIAEVERVASKMAESGSYLSMTMFWIKCQVLRNQVFETQEQEDVTPYRPPVMIFEKAEEKERELDAAA